MEDSLIKHSILLKIQNMIGYQAGFASLVYKFFDKNPSSSGIKD